MPAFAQVSHLFLNRGSCFKRTFVCADAPERLGLVVATVARSQQTCAVVGRCDASGRVGGF